MTRCKVGDLAMVTKALSKDDEKGLGRVVTVLNVWTKEHPARMPGEVYWNTGKEAWADCCLTPLKAPGQGETDEMLLIVGTPVKRTLETTK